MKNDKFNLPIAYYSNGEKIISNLKYEGQFFNGTIEYIEKNRKKSDIENVISALGYKKISLYEKIKDNDFVPDKNFELFKYNIFSLKAIEQIKKWHDKYEKIFENNNCIFNLSAGLDSRVLLTFLVNSKKTFYVNNYHRTTCYIQTNDDYDLDFIRNIICKKYKNIKLSNEIIKITPHFKVGGHFSEWCRYNYCFKNKEFTEYIYLCRKNKYIYPMIDKDLLCIDPMYPNLLSILIIYMYAPELLDYQFQTGKNLLTKDDFPLQFLKKFDKWLVK
jgi:hypothetical protein